jgi:hypothetical protein
LDTLNLKLTEQDLREIKMFANRAFLSETQPRELEPSEFLVFCYAKGLDLFLNKKGVKINLELVKRAPYEPTEE